jgi:RNA polymerase sigma-70 factor (ECF subfamily)
MSQFLQPPPSQASAAAGALDERTVVRRLEPVIRLYGMRRLRRKDAVADFVQDALIALLEAMRDGRVQQPEQVAPYAIGICRNLLRDGARSGARRNELWQIHGSVIEDSVEPSPYTSPLGRARLEDCVSKLQRRAREVLQRAFFEESSASEIATALGLAEGNVRVIRHRSIEQLRTCLERPLSWSAAG